MTTKTSLFIVLPLTAICLAGCSEADPAPAPENVTDPTLALYDCEDDDFLSLAPMGGPGFDDDGNLIAEGDSFVIHTTQLVYNEGMNGEVIQLSGAIIAELADHPGFVGLALASSNKCRYARTLGIWESEEAMYAMVTGAAHAEAMARTTELSATGKVTHWQASRADVEALDWDVARAQLAATAPSLVYQQ